MSVSFMPSLAMRSTSGVWAASLPKQEKSAHPMSSMKTRIILGGGADSPASPAAGIVAAAAQIPAIMKSKRTLVV